MTWGFELTENQLICPGESLMIQFRKTLIHMLNLSIR